MHTSKVGAAARAAHLRLLLASLVERRVHVELEHHELLLARRQLLERRARLRLLRLRLRLQLAHPLLVLLVLRETSLAALTIAHYSP